MVILTLTNFIIVCLLGSIVNCLSMFILSFMYQGLPRNEDGLLVTEIDLNLCRQVKDKWGFQVGILVLMFVSSLMEKRRSFIKGGRVILLELNGIKMLCPEH